MAVSRMMKSLVTGYAVVSIPDFEIGPSHILHVDEEIGPLSSPRSLSSDPGKSLAVKVIVAMPFVDQMRLSYLGKSHAAEETGALSYLDQLLPFNPDKFHVREEPEKYGYVQSHYRGSDTGMSGAGGGKGKNGEPTKDDERTLAWKLRLSVKAVTPKFNASAKISLEKKSG